MFRFEQIIKLLVCRAFLKGQQTPIKRESEERRAVGAHEAPDASVQSLRRMCCVERDVCV